VTDEAYLNRLNEDLLNRLQKGGEVFVSNAVVNGKYLVRACITRMLCSASLRLEKPRYN
jgi:aromatic-L-amino-acid/L-tryptophan decarboxylase